jgi:hypothetical protein
MLRALVLAALVFGVPAGARAQDPVTLRIRIVLVDAGGTPTPVPRHALLVSDMPPTTIPRRAVTGLDGTVDVRVRPGRYTVESDAPVAFEGKAFTWTQMVEVAAGRDTVLELTTANADVESAAPAEPGGAPAPESDPSFLLTRWRPAIVAVWTPTTRTSGVVVDAKGLVVTSGRGIAEAGSVQVQISPAIKVAARVLGTDPGRGLAILRVNPDALASVPALPLACDSAERPVVERGQEVFALGHPMRQETGMTSGTLRSMGPEGVLTTLRLARGAAGGPVFTTSGALLGITAVAGEDAVADMADAHVVRTEDVCALLASAEGGMQETPPPGGAHLPVEPPRPFPMEALREAAERRTGTVTPYEVSASAFDVALITPVLAYVADYQMARGRGRTTSRDTRTANPEPGLTRPLLDAGAWSDYVAGFPPVLLVRVTPRLVEGFWTRVAREAARTQGVELPPIRRLTSGFLRLRAWCGDAEVAPIHPFRVEHQVSETDVMHEGLYVFHPDALGPHCGTVRLVLYSEKEPEKGDTRVVDPAIVRQIWEDFAPLREPGR